MNQNRNQNRRRGRGNNRGGQGGGNQGNRIDSRARGNAPQMLEKYKKLAHDASLNGDRVLTEYYLQFADHYFRVVADMRSQKDEQRPPRREYDRDQPFDDYDGDEREEAAREEPRGGRRDCCLGRGDDSDCDSGSKEIRFLAHDRFSGRMTPSTAPARGSGAAWFLICMVRRRWPALH